MAKRATHPVVSHPVDLGDGADDRYVVMVAPPPAEDDGLGYVLAGLVLGTVLGAAVGLFLAPRSGTETRSALQRHLPGGLGVAPAAQPDDEAAPDLRVGPVPSQATPAALDPVAQVAQYQTPPPGDAAPPYTTGDGAAPRNTP